MDKNEAIRKAFADGYTPCVQQWDANFYVEVSTGVHSPAIELAGPFAKERDAIKAMKPFLELRKTQLTEF